MYKGNYTLHDATYEIRINFRTIIKMPTKILLQMKKKKKKENEIKELEVTITIETFFFLLLLLV